MTEKKLHTLTVDPEFRELIPPLNDEELAMLEESIRTVSDNTGMNQKVAEETISAALETIAGELAHGGVIQLLGFGTFEVKERAARTGRNPQTGETMEIPAAKVVSFKAGKALRERINR